MPFILEFHIVILAVPGGNSDIFTLLAAIVTLKVIHLDAIWQNLIKKIRKFKNCIKKKREQAIERESMLKFQSASLQAEKGSKLKCVHQRLSKYKYNETTLTYSEVSAHTENASIIIA